MAVKELICGMFLVGKTGTLAVRGWRILREMFVHNLVRQVSLEALCRLCSGICPPSV